MRCAATPALSPPFMRHARANSVVPHNVRVLCAVTREWHLAVPRTHRYKSSDPSSPDYMCLKLADFGLARDYSQKTMMKTACGTPGYVAPEILKNEGYAGPACDMWSTGVLLYILLCGCVAFPT